MRRKSGENSREDLDQFTPDNGSSFAILMAGALLSLTIIWSLTTWLLYSSVSSLNKNEDLSKSESFIDPFSVRYTDAQ